MPWYDGDCSGLADHTEPNDTAIQKLLQAAQLRLEVRTGREYTEFPEAAQADAETIRDVAWVIYEQLMSLKPSIQYDEKTQLEVNAQQFRTVSEIMKDRRANCLEIAMLFVSCALRAQLQPVIFTVDNGEQDHALVGLWLVERGLLHSKVYKPDGTIVKKAIPSILGAERFNDGLDYWNRISSANMLVIDVAGAAFGYPGKDGRYGLRFERAVTRAWNTLTSTSRDIPCALDLRQAQLRTPFPVKIRPDFVGREEDLDMVARDADAGNIVLSGTVGVGKTALAVQYAFEYRDEYPGGIFLLNAADQDRTLEHLAKFALACDIGSSSSRGRSEDPPTITTLASQWAQHVNKQGARALLIIDDVSEASFITDPITDGMSLASLKCRLLITTRDTELLRKERDFKNIDLSPLIDEDAATLLLNALPSEHRQKTVAVRVCKLLNNLPLLVRIAGFLLSSDKTLSLHEYERRLKAEGLLPVIELPAKSKYPGRRAMVVLSEAWERLHRKAATSCEILKLLSILPRNESVPFELLALMIEDAGYEQVRIELVREGARQLWAAGLAEQPEDDAIRIHAVVHEYAADRAAEEPGFVDKALQLIVDRLHGPEFYRNREDEDIVRCADQLRLLREPSRQNDGLSLLVQLFDIHLREGYDVLAQLALQSRLVGIDDLAKNLEQLRLEREGPWFRLRWRGKHERGHGPEAVGHSDAVSAVAIWPMVQDKEPSIAVSGAENGELVQWPLDALESRTLLVNLNVPISGLCIDPDGSQVYVSAWDGSLRAVTIDKDHQGNTKILGRHGSPANDCAVDPDGRFVVSVFDDGTIHVYSLPEGKWLWALGYPEHSPVLRCALARRAGSGEPVLITVSQSGVVRAWNPLTRMELDNTLDIGPDAAHNSISACALSPDGELSVVATREKVLLWNPHTGIRTILSTQEPYVAECCFSPDGSRIMLVGRTKRVAIYRVDSRSLDYHTDPWYHWLTACAFGGGGQLFYASDDGSVHLGQYSFKSGYVTKDIHIPGRLNWVNVFRAGKHQALSVSTDQSICLWKLENGKLERTIEGHANWVNAFATSSDGQHVLSGTDEGEVLYWSLLNSDERRILRGFILRANACAISRDGAFGLAASEDSTMRRWSLAADLHLCNHLTDVHRGAVTACAFSADGRYAVSGGDDAQVVLWDLVAGQFEQNFSAHSGRITTVEFVEGQPDTLLSSSWDGTVKCWSARSGQLIRDFTEHTDSVTSCGSAAGGVAFSVSLDRTLRRWKLAEGTSDIRIHLGHRLRGLVVDPSGDMILCSDMAGTVYLFDVVGSSDSPSPSAGTNYELSSV